MAGGEIFAKSEEAKDNPEDIQRNAKTKPNLLLCLIMLILNYQLI